MNLGSGKGNVGAGFEHFICNIGKGELLGDVITGIIVLYNKAAIIGSYTAYFDDILIITDDVSTGINVIKKNQKSTNLIYVEKNVLNFRDLHLHSDVVIFNVAGMAIKSFKLTTNRVSVNLPEGIYIVATKYGNEVYSQKIVVTSH